MEIWDVLIFGAGIVFGFIILALSHWAVWLCEERRERRYAEIRCVMVSAVEQVLKYPPINAKICNAKCNKGVDYE